MQKFAFIFPGNGTEYIGMGKKWMAHKEGQLAFEEAGDILGYDLKEICTVDKEDRLFELEFAHPAVLATSVAAFRIFREQYGIKPAFAAGHSAGEYAALTTSGVLSFADALRLVRKRAQLISGLSVEQKAIMVAVSQVDRATLETELEALGNNDGKLVISAYNSPGDFALSGNASYVAKLKEALSGRAEFVVLSRNTSSHSPLMAGCLGEFEQALEQCAFSDAGWPVIFNVSGLPVSTAPEMRRHLLQHIISPVQWMQTMQYMQAMGVTHALDLGPRFILQNYFKTIGSSIKVYSFENPDHLRMLEGEQVFTARYRQVLNKCLVASTATQNQNFDAGDYERGIVLPYQELMKLGEQGGQTLAYRNNLGKAAGLLEKILTSKKVDPAVRQSELGSVASTMNSLFIPQP